MKYQRTGHLQQERFYSEPVDATDLLIIVAKSDLIDILTNDDDVTYLDIDSVKKGLSIRQINRLTGIPRGIIQRALN